MNFSLLQFPIKFCVTCQSKFNIFLTCIKKTCMTDVPRTSPERPIIWSLERPATGSRGPSHLELLNICFFSKKR